MATPQLLISEYSLEGGLLACILPSSLLSPFHFQAVIKSLAWGTQTGWKHRPEGAFAATGSQVGCTLQGLNPQFLMSQVQHQQSWY